MKSRSLFATLCQWVLCLAIASPAFGLANRVFVSARSGNNANSCDNINTPCQTLTGALAQLNPDGEAIVLDSGGYGAVTITQGVTIEAPAGVTAFIHPSSGDAITINAGTATVTLRGLVLNVGTSNAITVNAVGTLNIENCFITGFANNGIMMISAGRLNVKGTDIKACGDTAIKISISAGLVQASIDHCHLDENLHGFVSNTTAPGGSTTTATNTTANHNSDAGWLLVENTGKDLLNLEFCTGSENTFDGLDGKNTNALSAVRYSNCVFANNGNFGVRRFNLGTVETRGNNTITGNGTAPTSGTIGTFSPM